MLPTKTTPPTSRQPSRGWYWLLLLPATAALIFLSQPSLPDIRTVPTEAGTIKVETVAKGKAPLAKKGKGDEKVAKPDASDVDLSDLESELEGEPVAVFLFGCAWRHPVPREPRNETRFRPLLQLDRFIGDVACAGKARQDRLVGTGPECAAAGDLDRGRQSLRQVGK